MKSRKTLSLGLAVGTLFAVCLYGGCRQYESPKPPAAARELNKRVEQASVKRQQMLREYKAMPAAGLIKKLENDTAKQVSPFNSLPYRELVSRGPSVAQTLKSSIAPDSNSFLTLLALRKVSARAYRTVEPSIRLKILIDTLRSSKYFNTWGIPHLYWEDAAKAIIEEGSAAIGSLKGLLQEKREAPVWGSEEVMEYQKYQYRVCDYALALIKEIKAEKVEMPVDPTMRDRLISREL